MEPDLAVAEPELAEAEPELAVAEPDSAAAASLEPALGNKNKKNKKI